MTLSERFKKHGAGALSVQWGNPYTTPTGERVMWAATFPADPDGRAIGQEVQEAAYAEAGLRPGCGYSLAWSPVRTKPPRRWSAEAKGRRRRQNLRNRLEKKIPLFADQLYSDEVERRPDYYHPKEETA